jgi:hypothetical protein
MKRAIGIICLTSALGMATAGPALAANPPGSPGLPSQSCQDLEPNTPGHSSSSPGSPFNEAGINSPDGGIGGQHYNETSQYDVACFQMSMR